MLHRLCASLVALVVVAGCAPKYTYQVDIVNHTSLPISVGLVHTGELVDQWDGPEHIAINAPQLASRHWGKVVEPGKGIRLLPDPVSFSAGGYLRVYAADRTVDELLGFTRDDPGRLDEPVFPGPNAFAIVRDKDGRLQAQPIRVTP